MATIFEIKNVIKVKCFGNGTTVNSDRYTETVTRLNALHKNITVADPF
jgi:hypothetical protein